MSVSRTSASTPGIAASIGNTGTGSGVRNANRPSRLRFAFTPVIPASIAATKAGERVGGALK